MGGAITPSEDPFGQVDPFQDAFSKQDDKFSWDNEPDPFLTDSGIESSATNNGGGGDSTFATGFSDVFSSKKDPFNVSFDANKNVIGGVEVSSVDSSSASNVVDKLTGVEAARASKISLGNNSDWPGSSENVSTLNNNNHQEASASNSSSATGRSRSVIGDPIASLLASLPVRSKTVLGEPLEQIDSFDPLAPSGNSPKSAWLSNEDLINENFGTPSTKPQQSAATTNSFGAFDSFADFPSDSKNNFSFDCKFDAKPPSSDGVNKNLGGLKALSSGNGSSGGAFSES